MCNILWNEKSVQKVHTVHKTLLLLEVSWEYTTSTTSDFLLHYVQSALERKVGAKFYTVPKTTFHIIICTQISKYPNVNIIAIIASDFTSSFGFCGLGVYHSFCTKNSHCARNFTVHIIICTQISKMSTSLLSLPVTSLQTSVSVVLVPTTVFALSTLYIQEAAICTRLLCTKL